MKTRLTYLLLTLLTLVSCSGPSVDLSKIPDVRFLYGNDSLAYRDPAVLYENGRFYVFCTMVRAESDSIFSYVVQTESEDLVSWTEPRILTARSQRYNFCSPGSVVKYGGEWVMCVCSYPRTDYAVDQPIRFGDQTARCYTMKSKDLTSWSVPELLRLKGNDVREEDMGRMIDAYLLEDHNEPGKWWCFYKQNGVSLSYSSDLKNWTYSGHYNAGENVSVIYDGLTERYIMMHSPSNGLGLKYSKNLLEWTDDETIITLGQKNWEWARGRLTAGALLDCRNVKGIEKYLMFFHGSGPLTETEGDMDRHCYLGLAWSDDLIHWQWPGSK